MQIRTKVVFSLIVLICLLSAGLKVILYQVVKPEFDKLERAQFLEEIDHTRNLLIQESNRLETLAYDWGVWDQSYAFVSGTNPGFMESNLSETSVRDLDVDQMFFVSQTGKVVWSQSRNDQYTRFMPDQRWPENHSLLDQQSLTSSGLLLTQNGPYLFGRAVIADGDDDQPRNGALILAKKLDTGLIDTLNTLDQHPITLIIGDTPPWQTHTEMLNEQEARVTVILPFENSEALSLFLQQQHSRKINHQASETITTVFLSTLVMGLIVTLIVYLFLRQHILIPIGRLNQQAEQFGHNQSADCFSLPQRDDEIGILFRTFRQMAEKILSYQNKLVKEKLSLEQVSMTDQLTGLLNRRYLDQSLPDKIRLSRAPQWTLVMLDLDHFKRINDQYGHDMGDLVLEQFSRLLRSLVREHDRCIRYGGEEFLLAMPGLNEIAARECCERIRSAVEQHRFGNAEQPLQLTISQGFILLSRDENLDLIRLEHYLGYADTALYTAKHNGRNCWVGVDARDGELPGDHIEMARQLEQGQITILQQGTAS